MKKIVFIFGGIVVLSLFSTMVVPNVVITFAIGDATATNIVHFINSTSNVITIISLIGIVTGVGGFSLAVVQTIKYLVSRSFKKAVAW